MDRKRSIVLGLAILGIAFGAGHMAQGKASAVTPQADGTAQATPTPAVASPVDTLPPVKAVQAKEPALPLLPVAATAEPLPEPTPQQQVQVDPEPAPECPVHLDLVPQDGAMIGVTLVAPCHAEERITLSHGGLAITGRTSATGSLFTALPAMEIGGEVAVGFADGTDQTAAMPMPELADIRRIAVQWMGDDRFALNVFKNGADYGQAGHLTAQPMSMLDGLMEPGSAVIGLGDATVTLPLLAEVYTLPADAIPVDLTVESEVTEKTCARELLGEMLDSRNGVVTVQELTLAMPECDALGDFIVLNNPLPDLTLAAAN